MKVGGFSKLGFLLVFQHTLFGSLKCMDLYSLVLLSTTACLPGSLTLFCPEPSLQDPPLSHRLIDYRVIYTLHNATYIIHIYIYIYSFETTCFVAALTASEHLLLPDLACAAQDAAVHPGARAPPEGRIDGGTFQLTFLGGSRRKTWSFLAAPSFTGHQLPLSKSPCFSHQVHQVTTCHQVQQVTTCHQVVIP